ncbi:hypothetical protein C8R44DRAFT_346966 [Mycena epipterygia]|nr:hypothetical protein C8R44DRAFT_346966 [Mycena epipterygia]
MLRNNLKACAACIPTFQFGDHYGTFLSLLTTLTTLTTLIHGTQALPALGPLKFRGFDNHNALDYYMKWDDASGTYQPNMGGMNDLMVGDTDPTGNRRPRSNCIFYVNQRPPMNDTDPNWAKKRALQFADLMNLAQAGGDYHTLYDVYNLEDAFNSAIAGPMADALESGLKRVWFQTTSEAFATLCQGSVYLVTEAEDIWQGSIWLTNEFGLPTSGRRTITEDRYIRSPRSRTAEVNHRVLNLLVMPRFRFQRAKDLTSTPIRRSRR